MEIQGEDGFNFKLRTHSEAVFGRGHGFRTTDTTVSRKHLLFRSRSQTDPNLSFQVLGKNPVWVFNQTNGKIRVFRTSDEAELVAGDGFCVSGKRPVWFTLKKIEYPENLQSRSELEGTDVKEFGFLVTGNEFDCYPKHKILDTKNWDRCLEEHKKGSDSDNEEDDSDSDDDWMGENEDDRKLVKKVRKPDKPKYTTRSKDRNRNLDDKKDGSSSRLKNAGASNVVSEDDEDDDDDETLGGFIVSDEEDSDREEDEEEEELLEDEE